MQFSFLILIALGLLLPEKTVARWLGIPTVPFVESAIKGSFSLRKLEKVIVDRRHYDAVDNDGETLIPPTLSGFASTFGNDLQSILGLNVPVITGSQGALNSIFISIGNASKYIDAAGRTTSKGYSIEIDSKGIALTGASPLGAWWGTRSLLQQAVLENLELAYGSAIDSPGWGIRGFMLDVGRHYYPPDFVIEMCSYMSFFKQNIFHLHLSDSSNLNPNISMERKLEFYSSFRLNSPAAAVAGLNIRPNESYYETDFERIQQSCASRGVTIIPEFDAPGHSLVFNQWKPELALSTDFSMLNISYPETIPTMEAVWKTFLPWFHSKTVHLGADEYSSAEISEYNRYVNTMTDVVSESSAKKTRIWGTFPPSSLPNTTNVAANVSIQHWEFFEANPYFDFIKKGYSVVNSDDAFYVVNKWSGSYPQSINLTRVFHGAPDGGPYAPNIFDTSNSTNNPSKSNPYVLGQIPVVWNDFGPNSSSVIEAYWAVRQGLPALADKQWGGDLMQSEFNSIFENLHAAIPGQNLDRVVKSKTNTILSYDFSEPTTWWTKTVRDKSGNGYDGIISGNCSVTESVLQLSSGCAINTPLLSKGRNYMLSFSVKPTSSTPGTLFSGSASSLKAGNGSISNVMFITGGNAFVLNYTLPLNTWTDVSVVAINNATYLSVTQGESSRLETFEFTTTIGVLSNSFVWGNPMSIEAPISVIGGDSFEGLITKVKLEDGADPSYVPSAAPLVTGILEFT
ncbi:Beta-hexosaminidase [Lachnellula cervina]|uniref:beta-N-acetylhexosaminidase n=1 Tax=Lachnellula cervina TaxID=1316786 RepID=A0A7D8YRF2_9HELO|nr:Beta-hexosaminidase [Lachnellula cervina]